VTKGSSNLPLAGQIAVITGAGRGIGQAISLKLAELGAHTVLCGRSRPALEQTAAAIQQDAGRDSDSRNALRSSDKNSHQASIVKASTVKASVVECDVTELKSVEALARHIETTFHRLDILVNNAGIGVDSGPLHQLAPEIWDDVLNTNLRGVYYCIRSLAPLMINSKARAGHIINISSLAGKNPVPNLAAYSASKWGLNGLSYSVAEELRQHNIRVSVICPGSVHTDFSPHAGKNSEKMLQATDVAHAVAMIVTQAPQSFASEILLRPTQKP
jgi:NAD(P)-dependent dehydrogenase (short-subunit alcohol dehydrogenase family)